MNLNELRRGISAFLSTGDPIAITVNLPSGSGICHIADVEPANWVSGFVGPSAGRWKLPGEEKKSFADSFGISAVELAGANRERLKDRVFEEWRITAPMPAINIAAFPQHIQEAFYEDTSAAPAKWHKSWTLVEEARKLSAYSGVSSVFAPSASGRAFGIQGMVLVANPRNSPMEMIRTGGYNDFIQE